MHSLELPTQLITDTKSKAVTLTPEIEAVLPGIDRAFVDADEKFLNDPENYLQNLEASTFKFRSSEGSEVACSLLHDTGSKPDELLVIFAPFADREPKSQAVKLTDYITADYSGGFISKEKYAPNSWNQTTKSAVIFDLLEALGKNIPVLTIYGPIPTHAYSFKERNQFKKGDFSPAGRLAKEAIEQVQDHLHGPTKSETQIGTISLSGASLGASNVIGAADSKELSHNFAIPAVTVQELILGPKDLPDLGNRFTHCQYVGVPSDEKESMQHPKIKEVAIRKSIDAHGSELIGTNARMLKGMKPSYMKGLTKPEATALAIERLLDNNVNLLVALAENSSLSFQTPYHLPYGRENLIKIRGENGQMIGHLADEHVALSALIAVLNIARLPK